MDAITFDNTEDLNKLEYKKHIDTITRKLITTTVFVGVGKGLFRSYTIWLHLEEASLRTSR